MKHFAALLLAILTLVALGNQGQAQVTQNEAVEGLLYLFNTQPRAVAQFLVSSATPDTTEGKAFRLVIKELLARSETAQVAETRSRLSEADRAILKAAKQSAVFDPKEVFKEKISDPAQELKLNTVENIKN